MIETIAAAFKTVGLAKSLAATLGLIQSIESKVDTLIASEVGAGFENLRQAERSEAEALSLIRQARSHFNKAIQMEQGGRRALAYLGLASCHHLLGDRANHEAALESILAIEHKFSLSGAIGLQADVLFGESKKAKLANLIRPGLGMLSNITRRGIALARDREQARLDALRLWLRNHPDASLLYTLQLGAADCLGRSIDFGSKLFEEEELRLVLGEPLAAELGQ